ncbi:hypothetical protein FSARC_3630 [Fusarium sarcochroum]|uniref:Uncharacterized protein n=1 Tax=Fusarium sarcochroum TaxID=1208366 RepID=A0A8H4U421_9HYPO|nr:hypothetical protein FSARC_3630 [Fusarium sarcochroum]
MDPYTSFSEPQRVPYLPPEILIRIVAESEEFCCCLINLLTKGELKCEGFQDRTTVIYTRGTRNGDGTFNRGSIETLPLHHRCIFGTFQSHSAIPHNPSDGFSVELKRWHVTKRDLVFDFGIKDNVVSDLVRLERQIREFPILTMSQLIRDQDYKYAFLGQNIFDTIPIASDQDHSQRSGTASSGAYTQRLRRNDPLLVCQKIRHLMLRATPKTGDDFVTIGNELLGQVGHLAVNSYEIVHSLYLNQQLAMLSMLDLEWSLLENLETLCLDLTPLEVVSDFVELRPKFVKMGQHLNLKTLILLGVPCLAKFNDLGEEAWVAKLEDQDYCVPELDPEISFDDYKPGLISVLKECLRPGGQVHFIADLEPGESYWPGSGDEITIIDD